MTANTYEAIAASITPLKDGGRALDTMSFESLTSFLASGSLDGVLTCGTTGEGMLLSVAERRTVTELFLDNRPVSFQVVVHAGAQTTADTLMLAAHAKDVGADAVAVIAPPYFPLDDEELTRHLVAAANACDPLPFYVYEFAARSGYAIPPAVVRRVRDAVSNDVGMKVSDLPFAAVRPYLELGVDVFVGQEPLAIEGMAGGAVGSVSGLAAAFPEIVARLVHERDAGAHDAVVMLRERLAGIPFHAALKEVLVARDVLRSADVRPPLRGLTGEERKTVLDVARELGPV